MMSRTEIYAITPDGDIELEAKIGNSYRGAMYVWTTLSVKYGLVKPGEEGYLIIRPGLMDRLWKLRDDGRLSWWEKVALISTFDNVVIMRDDMHRLIVALNTWAAQHSEGSQSQQAWTIRRLLDDPAGFRGICFNQTSVCANPWWVYDSSGDDEEGRPFNIDRDTGWWDLFAEYPQLLTSPPA
jgi:hypothetical protein